MSTPVPLQFQAIACRSVLGLDIAYNDGNPNHRAFYLGRRPQTRDVHQVTERLALKLRPAAACEAAATSVGCDQEGPTCGVAIVPELRIYSAAFAARAGAGTRQRKFLPTVPSLPVLTEIKPARHKVDRGASCH